LECNSSFKAFHIVHTHQQVESSTLRSLFTSFAPQQLNNAPSDRTPVCKLLWAATKSKGGGGNDSALAAAQTAYLFHCAHSPTLKLPLPLSLTRSPTLPVFVNISLSMHTKMEKP